MVKQIMRGIFVAAVFCLITVSDLAGVSHSDGLPGTSEHPLGFPLNAPNVGMIQVGSLPAVVTVVDANGVVRVDGSGNPVMYLNPLQLLPETVDPISSSACPTRTMCYPK